MLAGSNDNSYKITVGCNVSKTTSSARYTHSNTCPKRMSIKQICEYPTPRPTCANTITNTITPCPSGNGKMVALAPRSRAAKGGSKDCCPPTPPQIDFY